MSNSSVSENEYFTDDNATFGDRLQAARRAKGLSPEGLAEKLGVGEDAITAWEDDIREPRANRLQMLSGILNVSIVWLITGTGQETSDMVDTLDRSIELNDTLGEIKALKQSLIKAVDRIEQLEERLLAAQ